MRDYNVEGATLVFVLNVMNPNSFPLKVDGLKYNIELDGKQLIDGKLEQAANLAANSETSIDVPIPVRFDQLFSSALDFALKGKSPYRIRGEAKFGLFNIPFDESGELSIKR